MTQTNHLVYSRNNNIWLNAYRINSVRFRAMANYLCTNSKTSHESEIKHIVSVSDSVIWFIVKTNNVNSETAI